MGVGLNLFAGSKLSPSASAMFPVMYIDGSGNSHDCSQTLQCTSQEINKSTIRPVAASE